MLDCAIIHILLIIQHNGNVSLDNYARECLHFIIRGSRQ